MPALSRAPRLVALALLPLLSASRPVTLSNTRLPVDTTGAPLQTGETSIFAHAELFYIYANVWGDCPGVDCCTSPSGCASCCFSPPSSAYPDTCVYADQHVVVAYSTRDFSTFTPLGVVLPLSARVPGIEFRPQVIYSPARSEFVMWYEDRWSGQRGMAVAVSDTPAGPFRPLSNSTTLPGPGRVGDYDVFIDADGVGYHVRTGLTIVRLNDDYTAPAVPAAFVSIPNGGVEGPAMFKRGAIYYLLVGPACCACRGGSDVVVYTARAPLGPWTQQAHSVGRNVSQPFDVHSPLNYATHAQQTKVIAVPNSTGGTQWLWVGNQWVSQVGAPRNTDLLYFAVLEFDDTTGAVLQMTWADTTTIDVP